MRTRLSTLGPIVMIGLLIGLSPDALASGIDVSVGYADSLRPNSFFPNPWEGARIRYSTAAPTEVMMLVQL